MTRRHALFSLVAVLLAVLLFPAPAASAQTAGDSAAAKFIYSKDFPGSQPAFQQLTVNPDGSAVYQEAKDDPTPVEFQLPPKTTTEIFSLAEQMQYFGYKLESDLKIARMGQKTFRYEGKVAQEQTFNYSADLHAQKLLQLVEKICESQRLFIRFEYTLRFDRLGINDALLSIDSAQQGERLIGSAHFLPLLDRVINSKRFMNISRDRADAIARAIRQANDTGAKAQ